MSTCGPIGCPVCSERMFRDIDTKSNMIVLGCRKCNFNAGLKKLRYEIDLYCIGMPFSLKDIRTMLDIFIRNYKKKGAA